MCGFKIPAYEYFQRLALDTVAYEHLFPTLGPGLLTIISNAGPWTLLLTNTYFQCWVLGCLPILPTLGPEHCCLRIPISNAGSWVAYDYFQRWALDTVAYDYFQRWALNTVVIFKAKKVPEECF